MSKSPLKEYIKRVSALDNAVRNCIAVSQKCASIKSPTGAHFYASVLFTILCTRAISLAILSPHSPWSKKIIDHWDYASMASITRSILEIRLAFFYLCIENCTKEEWDCRWNIFNLHDCTARIRLFEEMQSDRSEINGFNQQANKLRERLTSNNYFMSLSEVERKKYLHGNNAFMQPLERIAERANVDVHTFRWLYKFFSSHVHGYPLSFYRMDEQDRGRGVESEVEIGYSSLCLSFAITLLVAARDEMEGLFKNIKNA